MGKNLGEYAKEELIELVGQLKKRQKYGLVWEDKPENVVTECQQKLPVLTEDEDKHISGPSDEPTHLMIEGDNYQALAALNYTHAGKVDVIYIDPPYNTGNKDFIYNDSFVDKEDTFRHSKWLSFMEKRLRLAKNLLSNDGVIFISIDDNEQANLKLLCEKIFGENNFIGCAPRKTRGAATTKGTAELQTLGDYLLIFAKHKKSLILQKKIVGQRKYPYSDARGKYYTVPLQDNGPHGTREARPNLWYPIYVNSDGSLTYNKPAQYQEEILPQKHQNKEGCWMWSKKKFDTDGQDLEAKNGKIFIKHYFKDGEDENLYRYEKLWIDDMYNAKGTRLLSTVLGQKNQFSNPKPAELIKYCIMLSKNKDGVILDFFAGSGTTGQAVLELNKEDGGHRQFILVTNNEADGKKDAGEEGIARKVTYPRIKTVISGIRPDGTKYSDGIPANLRYFKTDFVEKGQTNDDTKELLTEKCADMVRIRENTFELIKHDIDFQLYRNDKYYTAIIFNQYEVENIWHQIEELVEGDKPVHTYIFSYSSHNNEEEIPETKLTYQVQPVPEEILKIYQRIFKKERK